MDNLTPDQAQALFEAGGFLILTSLPEGREFGIDGTFHLTRRFSGVKFLTPGLHLITWSPPPSSSSSPSSSGPSSIPLRSAFVHFFKPKERVVLQYDQATETVPIITPAEIEIISDDHLKTLDKELAPYPFEGLERWRCLCGHVDQEMVHEVFGPSGRVDGMNPAEGEVDEKGSKSKPLEGERTMRFPVFNLKRSWRDGAIGEEITRYAKDKSWLMGDVLISHGSDPGTLLGYFELAFLLVLYLSSYSALMVYKRLLSLFCRSSHILASPSTYLQHSEPETVIRRTSIAFVGTIAAQLAALPESAFETELPEMDVLYLDEIEALRCNLSAVLAEWTTGEQVGIREAWRKLRAIAKDQYRWKIKDLSYQMSLGEDEEDEDEEGEYAPVVVEA